MRPGQLGSLLRQKLSSNVMALLGDGSLTDVWLNADGRVFVDGKGGRRCVDGTCVEASEREAGGLLLASGVGAAFSEENPILSGDFNFEGLGHFRVQGFLPPVVEKAVLIFRRLAPRVYPLFGDAEGYFEQGILSQDSLDAIRLAMVGRRNILVIGDMSSGKTTLANAILHHLGEWGARDRILVLEDTRELQVTVPNVLSLLSGSEKGASLEELCKAAFRTGATRICVGEVRGQEALQLLLLWAGGHGGGLATMHGGSPETALRRLNGLAQIASAAAQHELIAAAISLVISIKRDANGVRKVGAPAWIHGFENGRFDLRGSPPEGF